MCRISLKDIAEIFIDILREVSFPLKMLSDEEILLPLSINTVGSCYYTPVPGYSA